MHIAVLAANGRTGKVFVDQALKAGHYVRAGVHGTSNLSDHPRLTVVQCDATKLADLKNLVLGQNAVVSFIGHVKHSPKRLQTEAIESLIQIAKETHVTRLISLTGTGVRFEGDKISLVDRILNISISLIDPDRVADGIAHVEALKRSDLDWTVLRVLKLQNTEPKPYTLTLHGPTKWYVSREEVAAAALEVLETETFVKQAPILSPRR